MKSTVITETYQISGEMLYFCNFLSDAYLYVVFYSELKCKYILLN